MMQDKKVVIDANLNDTVTEHMRTDLARLQVDHTVGEALAAIRETPPPTRIVYFYVVDSENRLQGVIPARSLLLSVPETNVRDIMLRSVVAIPDTATVLDACEFFMFHRFLAFPVIDAQRRLIGAIDVELYTDELRDLGGGLNDELFQLVGVHLARARRVGILAPFRSRFPWLICNIAGGIACAFLCSLFEADLTNAVALAMFIPVVLSLGESVGIQSLTLSLQALRGKRPSWGIIARKLCSEFLVGGLLGGASGLVVGAVALGWIGKMVLALAILGGITGGVACAAVLGATIPRLLHRLKLDPQVAAGPVALTSADIITLVCYFSFARWLLS